MRYFIIFLAIKLFSQTIYIATSSNVSYVLNDLIKEFKKSHCVEIKPIISSSGKLTAQIMHNAPYDIFLSADIKYPTILYKKGFAKSKVRVYAKGEIIFFRLKNDFDLLKAKRIIIANPKFAPYGRAAIEVFKNLHIYDKIKDKLVFSESVSGVIPYVINSTYIGVVAKSLLFSPYLKNKKFFIKEINSSLYSPIKQGVVLLSEKKEAKEFFEFLFSKKAKSIFKKYGYE